MNDKLCVVDGKKLSGQQKKFCSEICRKEEARRLRLGQIFSITPEEYDRILSEQNGGCGICGRTPTAGKRHAVDHDHQTGFVRGLLCFQCNRRILGARSAAILIKTAAYVSDPPAQRVIGERIAPGRPKKKRATAKRKRRRT